LEKLFATLWVYLSEQLKAESFATGLAQAVKADGFESEGAERLCMQARRSLGAAVHRWLARCMCRQCSPTVCRRHMPGAACPCPCPCLRMPVPVPVSVPLSIPARLCMPMPVPEPVHACASASECLHKCRCVPVPVPVPVTLASLARQPRWK